MNVNTLKYTLAAVVAVWALSITVPVRAQLAPLPADPLIQKGTLPCGVSYYMVTNPAEKGYAHVAVVQRDEPLSETKREELDPAFFARMGIAPGPEGFVCDHDGSTVYRFSHIPFYQADVLDSTLLFTFARVAESKAQQAVIVSGDIDAVELKKKMDIFSMLVPRMLVKENHRPDYVWEPSPAPVVRSTAAGRPEVAVTYASARIPFEFMNTAQSVVTDLFGLEFQELLRHRLARNLADAGIPYGEIGFQSMRSADYGGDERYTVYVSVKKKQLDPAMRVIASTLGEMDAFGVTVEEFAESKQVIAPHLRQRASHTPSPEEYVDLCTAHFLYGASLAPRSERLHYFSRKNVADSVEARLFNNFSAAMLEGLSNFTLEYRGAPDSLDHDDALFYYNLAYLYGSVAQSGKDYCWHSGDTLALQSPSARVKIKSEKTEPVTGGTIWTLSNGTRVIFKQVKGSGNFSYALQLNGGLAQIPDLLEGEGGHIGHLLPLYDVAGIPAPAFRDLLLSNGISMETRVELNSMDISGSAPSNKLSLLLKSLVAIANRRTPNASAFQEYCKRETLATPELETTLFSMLNPGYSYSPYKQVSALSEETLRKAGAFYDERFSRINDGVLILSGDLSPEAVKKSLLRFMGAFHTVRSALVRKTVQMQTLSGVSTHQGTYAVPGVYLLCNASYAMTTAHFYTAYVGLDALQDALVRELSAFGYAVDVQLRYCVQPQEHFQVLVSACPLPGEGRPAGVRQMSGEEVIPAVRSALKRAGEKAPSQADVDAWKAKLEARVNRILATPEGFVNTLLARYASNKDITSRYHEAIASIDAQQVQAFLQALQAGGCVEYLAHE